MRALLRALLKVTHCVRVHERLTGTWLARMPFVHVLSPHAAYCRPERIELQTLPFRVTCRVGQQWILGHTLSTMGIRVMVPPQLPLCIRPALPLCTLFTMLFALLCGI